MYLDPVTTFNHANTNHHTRIRRATVRRMATAVDTGRERSVAPWRSREP
jgi:hypothetical protein